MIPQNKFNIAFNSSKDCSSINNPDGKQPKKRMLDASFDNQPTKKQIFNNETHYQCESSFNSLEESTSRHSNTLTLRHHLSPSFTNVNDILNSRKEQHFDPYVYREKLRSSSSTCSDASNNSFHSAMSSFIGGSNDNGRNASQSTVLYNPETETHKHNDFSDSPPKFRMKSFYKPMVPYRNVTDCSSVYYFGETAECHPDNSMNIGEEVGVCDEMRPSGSNYYQYDDINSLNEFEMDESGYHARPNTAIGSNLPRAGQKEAMIPLSDAIHVILEYIFLFNLEKSIQEFNVKQLETMSLDFTLLLAQYERVLKLLSENDIEEPTSPTENVQSQQYSQTSSTPKTSSTWRLRRKHRKVKKVTCIPKEEEHLHEFTKLYPDIVCKEPDTNQIAQDNNDLDSPQQTIKKELDLTSPEAMISTIQDRKNLRIKPLPNKKTIKQREDIFYPIHQRINPKKRPLLSKSRVYHPYGFTMDELKDCDFWSANRICSSDYLYNLEHTMPPPILTDPKQDPLSKNKGSLGYLKSTFTEMTSFMNFQDSLKSQKTQRQKEIEALRNSKRFKLRQKKRQISHRKLSYRIDDKEANEMLLKLHGKKRASSSLEKHKVAKKGRKASSRQVSSNSRHCISNRAGSNSSPTIIRSASIRNQRKKSSIHRNISMRSLQSRNISEQTGDAMRHDLSPPKNSFSRFWRRIRKVTGILFPKTSAQKRNKTCGF